MNPTNPNQNQQNLAQSLQPVGNSQFAQGQPQDQAQVAQGQQIQQPAARPVQNQNVVAQSQKLPPVQGQNVLPQAQPVQSPVSAGKPELGPQVDANVDLNVEKYVESSEQEPILDDDVVDAGVENVNSEPQIHYSAQAVGVSKSIPDPKASIYSPPVFKDAVEADKTADDTSPDKSLAWVAREVAKNLKKTLSNKQQPTEV